MLTCVLNYAEGQLDIVLGNNTGIISSQSWPISAKGPIKGAEILAPALSALFTISKIEICDVERWACVYGPGSFTGIRLVLGTVAAVRRISRAKNASIDFLQALALDVALEQQNNIQSTPNKIGYIWTISHARRNMVHAQAFKVSDNLLPEAVHDVQLYLIKDIIKILQASPAHSVILGSGLKRNWEALAPAFANGLQDIVKPIEHSAPTPKALWELALHANYHEQDIEPLYVRPCDAVENLDLIAQKMGLEPQMAHARLEALLKQNNF